MANYNKKKKSVGKIIAGVLCGVLCVTAVAGAGTALYMGAKNNGWFDKEDEVVEQDDTVTGEATESAGSLYVNETESASNGLKLTAARLTADQYEEYGISAASVEDAYTVTASYNESATNPKFAWSLGGLDNATSYVTITPSSDTKSCVVTCKAAFGSQITLYCTAADGASGNLAEASCTIDYIKRLTDRSFDFRDDTGEYTDSFSWSNGNSTITWAASKEMGISSDSTIKVSYDYTFGTGSYQESYTETVSLYSNITGSTVTYSGNYRSFISAITGVSSSLSDEAFMSGVYNALISSYNSSTAAAVFTVKVTGQKTGLSTTFTYNLIINPSEFFVKISSVTLDQTSLYF